MCNCCKECEEKSCNKTLCMILAIIGAIVVIAGIAYAIYRYCTPDYLEDFEDEDDLLDEEDIAAEVPAEAPADEEIFAE